MRSRSRAGAPASASSRTLDRLQVAPDVGEALGAHRGHEAGGHQGGALAGDVVGERRPGPARRRARPAAGRRRPRPAGSPATIADDLVDPRLGSPARTAACSASKATASHTGAPCSAMSDVDRGRQAVVGQLVGARRRVGRQRQAGPAVEAAGAGPVTTPGWRSSRSRRMPGPVGLVLVVRRGQHPHGHRLALVDQRRVAHDRAVVVRAGAARRRPTSAGPCARRPLDARRQRRRARRRASWRRQRVEVLALAAGLGPLLAHQERHRQVRAAPGRGRRRRGRCARRPRATARGPARRASARAGAAAGPARRRPCRAPARGCAAAPWAASG